MLLWKLPRRSYTHAQTPIKALSSDVGRGCIGRHTARCRVYGASDGRTY